MTATLPASPTANELSMERSSPAGRPGGRSVRAPWADRLFAIDNFDPNAQASVLSRGLVGNLGERIVVASPIYKHHFDLKNGECLEAPETSVAAYPVRVEKRTVWVGV